MGRTQTDIMSFTNIETSFHDAYSPQHIKSMLVDTLNISVLIAPEESKAHAARKSDSSLALLKAPLFKFVSELNGCDTFDNLDVTISSISLSRRSSASDRKSILNLQAASESDEEEPSEVESSREFTSDETSDEAETSSDEEYDIIAEEISVDNARKTSPIKNPLLHGFAETRRRASVAVWSDPYLSQFASTQQARSTISRNIAALKVLSTDDTEQFAETTSVDDAALEMAFLQLSFKEVWQMRRVSRQWKSVIDSSAQLMRKIDLGQMSAVIDDYAIACISNVAGINLEILLLRNNWRVTNAGVKSIASNCPNLEVLDLSGCWDVTDESLIALSHGTKLLRSIDLSNCRKVTDHGFVALMTNCNNMRDLFLSYCKALTDGAVVHVASRCVNVRRVNLQRCVGITDAGWEEFGRSVHFKLQELVLSDCSFLTDATMTSIAISCPNLVSLNLSFCCAMTEEGLRKIASGCVRLRNLDLSFCGSAVTDTTLEYIAKNLSQLERLSIRGCNGASNNGITSLINLGKNLKAVNLSNCKNISSQFLDENIPKAWTMLNAQVAVFDAVAIDGGGEVYGSCHIRRYSA